MSGGRAEQRGGGGVQQLPAVARILFRSVCQSGEPTRSPAQQDAGHQVCCRGRRVRTFTSLSNFTVLPVAVGPAQARTSTAAAVRSHLEPEVEQRWRPARSVFFPLGGRLLAALVERARPGVSFRGSVLARAGRNTPGRVRGTAGKVQRGNRQRTFSPTSGTSGSFC